MTNEPQRIYDEIFWTKMISSYVILNKAYLESPVLSISYLFLIKKSIILILIILILSLWKSIPPNG
jgi:hypothetical protein